MTNKLAIIFAAVVIGAIAWDVLANDSAATIFMARKGLDLIDWMAIWR